jgi:glutathione S-transferase
LSVADVAVASYIKYGQLFFRMKIDQYANVARYMKDVESRDAFKKTVGGG